jgi:Uma2 family endonuclease
MSTDITRKLFTYSDCLRMAEIGVLSPAEKVELIRGELFVMSPPGPRHGAAVDRTTEAMRDLTNGKAIIRSQGGVVLDEFVAPLPDIAILAPRADYYAERNPGAADILLIVEVANTSLEYDLTVKRDVYAITGIVEYWVADLTSNRLLVHTNPAGDRYQTIRELHRGDRIAPSQLPSCELAVDLLLP